MRRLLLALPLVLFVVDARRVEAQSYRVDDDAARAAFASALVLSGDELFAARPGEMGFFPSPPDHTGMIHVFTRDGSGDWAERDTITSTSAEVGDGFASALAVSGNVMVVGAAKQGEGRGAAYVFERSDLGAPWREVTRLSLADGSAGDRMGATVAIASEQLLVGVPGREAGKGAVVVYMREGDGWTEAATLTASEGAEGDGFGQTLSTTADRVLIGAPGPIPFLAIFGGSPPRIGKAYVFEPGGDGEWTEVAQLTLATEEPSALGAAVMLLGDAALVGAPLTNQFVGSVVRFERSASGEWTETGHISPAEPAPGTGLGLALAAAGSDLFVGAPMAGGAGRVFVFRRSDSGQWSEVQQMESPAQFAFLGSAIAASENEVVLGAPGADFFEGSGLVFRRQGEAWQEAGTVTPGESSLQPITGGVRECRDGKIEDFSCADVDLVAFLPVSEIGGKRGMIVNDMWGWTDPETGHEIAIVGRADATVFIDLSNPENPVYLGELPMHEGATANLWRDMKVYADHVFIVADGAGPHGVQVFDLRQLRDVTNPPVTFEETAHYDRIHSAHNIVMNEQTGFAYVVGASMGGETCGGGLHMIDVREPANPTFAGCFADTRTGNARTGYSHDAQCITYNGPDEDFRSREICFGSNETALSIADVTDKANPRPIATAAYPNVAYLHQGWVSDDHRHLFMNDEGDELAGSAPRTRTLVWDISDLEDPILVKEYLGETEASDHNLYVKGNYVYESNYVSGLRILDISDPANPVEVGHFDTVPWGDDVPGFAGSWTNYPYFESGNIVVTSMREGVFIVRYRGRTIS